jgi:hypothetical protein
MSARYDPLLVTCIKFLEEERGRLAEELETSRFTDLYELGLIQGRLQGIAMARKAIDDASRAIEAE